MKFLQTLFAIPLLLLLAACGNPEPAPEAKVPAETDPALAAVFVDTAPAGEAVPIPEARSLKAPGDPVVLEGRIMGVTHPFVEGRAVFVLGDNATLTACSDTEGDQCATPWDTCCEPSEIRQAGTATVQIVDAEGDILRQGLEGVNGLEKLATVRVAGTLAPDSTPEAMIVNATAIHVSP